MICAKVAVLMWEWLLQFLGIRRASHKLAAIIFELGGVRVNTINIEAGQFYTIGVKPLTKTGKPATLDPGVVPDIKVDNPLLVDLILPDPTGLSFQLANLGDGGTAQVTVTAQGVTGILTVTLDADTKLASFEFEVLSGPNPIP